MLKMKKKTRAITDIAMTVMLPMLMAYSLIGETFHEILGTLILIVFIAHHIFNRKWYGNISKGKYGFQRSFRTVLDLVLFVIMIALPVSGMIISKHLYTFIRIPGTSAAREIHLMISCWGFVLMCVHAGTHLTALTGKLRKAGKPVKLIVCALDAAISAYGAIAFFKRQLPDYMFRKTTFAFFDFDQPRLFFFLDYLAVMVLFASVGYLISSTKLKKIK